jgi:primary-amine oxidase
MQQLVSSRRSAVVAVILVAVAGATVGTLWAARPASPASVAHPLDPLSALEIEQAVRIAKAAPGFQPDMRFTFIQLVEPPKKEVLDFVPGRLFVRRAQVGLYSESANKVIDSVVELTSQRLLEWRAVSGVQPAYMDSDQARVDRIMSMSAEWQAALKRRGLDVPATAKIEYLSIGPYGDPPDVTSRQVLVFVKTRAAPYGAAVPELAAYVNLTTGEILRIVDRGNALPVPDVDFRGREDELTPVSRPWQTSGVKPVYRLEGRELRWGPWRMRLGLDAREGLVLHTVQLNDGGRDRMVLYRASMSEMAVPYGDPSAGWYTRTIFDAGETGMAKYGKSPLIAGVDVPLDSTFIDGVVHDDEGKVVSIPRVMAIYERASGALWRHARHGVAAHELVIATFATIDNYDYGFHWIFREDGSIKVELILTGIMAVKAIDPAGGPTVAGGPICATVVSAGRSAPNHQHFFNFRLDFDVDGASDNSIFEIEAAPPERADDNPYGNVIATRSRVLERESDAKRTVDLTTGRKWKIVQGSRQNAWGQASGFMLVPGENALPIAMPGSMARKRAGFMEHHVWATPHAAAERYAAGDYPFTGFGAGLPQWTRANRSVARQDIVVWYTLGVTHLPRTEEWPVMPAHRASFELVPAGFFSRNPVLNAAKPNNGA